jgi:hypothetical protein
LTGGSWNNPMTIQTDQLVSTDRDINLNAVTPGFFATLGARIVAGRDFDQHDNRPVGDPGGYRSAIVNEAFARRYLAGRNPLGALVCQGTRPGAKPNIEIVGVVSDFSYRGLREQSEQAYFPLLEGGVSEGAYYVKVRGTPEGAFQSIRAIVHNADPALPISYLRTVDEQVSRSLNTERMLTTLSGGFAALALLLSLVGLYGVMSFVVTQRTREIGIRLALGATEGSAIWLVVQSQLFGVKPTDPLAIAAATFVLASAAFCAALIPAYRASAVNPIEALRFD